ncbi:MAG: SCO family protein [Alphaproteobacteria bacterium]|nr:SCO family protein [Alphaproteobacteria bacterium]
MPNSRILLVVGVTVLVVVLGLLGQTLWELHRTPTSAERGTPLIGGAFTLTDHTGRARSDTDFRGRHMLVYFGYSFCPDVCGTELLAITQAVEHLGPAGDKVALLFITIDPERDTKERLAEYVAEFHPRLVGLTGTAEAIRAVAKAYRVFYKRGDAAGGDADYLMDHSTAIYFMDREGKFLTHFPFQTPPEKMAQTIKRYL